MKRITMMVIIFIYCIFGYAPFFLFENHSNMKWMNQSYVSSNEYDTGQCQPVKHRNIKQHEIRDEASGISVKGELGNNVHFTVRRDNVYKDSKNTLMLGYRLHISGSFQGELRVSFPVGWQYEGQPITVQSLKGNNVSHMVHTRVKHGQVRVCTRELTSYRLIVNRPNKMLALHGWLLIICIGAIIICLLTMNLYMISVNKKEQKR